MPPLYSNDIEGDIHLGVATGFTNVFSPIIVLDKTQFAPAPVVQGNKSFGANDNGLAAYWNGDTELADQGIRTAEKIASLSQGMGHFLRSTPTLIKGYRTSWESSGGNIRGSIVVYDGGTISTDSSGYTIPAGVGDVLHMESTVVGNTIELRLWINTGARPAAPTVSVTKTNYPTGCIGVRKALGGGSYAAVDQIVIAGGAAGLDHFYPAAAAPTLSGTVVADDAVASGSMFLAGLSSLTGAVTADDAMASGSFGSAGAASVLSRPIRSTATKLLMPHATFAHAVLMRVADRHPAVSIPSPTSNSDARIPITSTGMTAGVDYMLAVWNADGSLAGIEKVTAEAAA